VISLGPASNSLYASPRRARGTAPKPGCRSHFATVTLGTFGGTSPAASNPESPVPHLLTNVRNVKRVVVCLGPVVVLGAAITGVAEASPKTPRINVFAVLGARAQV
jgi:hypothetical protein